MEPADQVQEAVSLPGVYLGHQAGEITAIHQGMETIRAKSNIWWKDSCYRWSPNLRHLRHPEFSHEPASSPDFQHRSDTRGIREAALTPALLLPD